MKAMHRSRIISSTCTIAALIAGFTLGCGDKTEAGPDAAASATATGNKNEALLDNKVKEAMKDVEASPSASAPSGEGPPQTGIFAAGEGAKALARDSKLSLIEKGADPKLKVDDLGAVGGAFLLQVSQASQPGGVRPTVDYTIKIRGPQADGEAKPAATATSTAAQAWPAPVSFVIVKATPSQQQQGQLPGGFDKLISAVEGSRVDAMLQQNGRLTDLKTVYGEGIDQVALREFVDIARSALTLFFPPMPAEKVGKGGFWIMGDQANVEGMDLIRYRVTKLTEMTDDLLTFELDVRNYVADPTQVPNLVRGKGLSAKAFEGPGKGIIQRKKGNFIPEQAQVVSQMVVYLASPDNPEQAQPVQFTLQARLAGPKSEGDEKKPVAP